MAKVSLEGSEGRFLATLAGGLDKLAVELDPETRQLLGEQDAPEQLDQLEASAGGGATPAPPAPPAPAPPAAPPPPVQGDVEMEPEEQPAPMPEQPSAEPVDLEPAAPPPEHEVVQPDETDLPAPESLAPDIGPDAEPPADRATYGKIFNAKGTHPLQLLDVLTSRYRDQWIEWEPETLWWAIRRDFGPISEITRNKVMALRLAVATYQPWADWDTFENCGLAWNDTLPMFGAYQPMTPSQIAFAVSILAAVHPAAPINEEVCAYQAMILEESGFVYAPEIWYPGAQAFIDRKTWAGPFRDEVHAAWDKLKVHPLEDLQHIAWDEKSALDVHMLRLFAVRAYLESKDAVRGAAAPAVPASTPTSPPVPS